MVFNVVAMNQDDHTKNISFLMNKEGKWKLSPAYDMSWSFNPNGIWTSRHQMSINNKWNGISKQDLLDVATNVNIKKPNEIIQQVCEAVSNWKALAKEYGVPADTAETIDSTLLYKDF